MATATNKLAPRILINENDISDTLKKKLNSPITLMFGFAPMGRINEMVVCNTPTEVI